MNMTLAESEAYFQRLGPVGSEVEIIVCPPFTVLDRISGAAAKAGIALGGQDVYWEERGPYTGEISAIMLADAGARYCLVGHAERRKLFGETDRDVNRKAAALLRVGLMPIVCLGESREERDAGRTRSRLEEQMTECFRSVSQAQAPKCLVLYEPVWAVGSGRRAEPAQVQEAHALIRSIAARLWNPETADKVRIVYGGSVTPENSGELFILPDVDGLGMGGASLDPDNLFGLAKACAGRRPK
jgi:triosephosphate isomerase